jgi:hypothetical protein
MLKQIYPSFNYSKYLIEFFRREGFSVKVKRFRMRMYVGDILKNPHVFDLHNFYRFIHNTDKYPSSDESRRFLEKIKRYQKNNYLNFKDELIIVERS